MKYNEDNIVGVKFYVPIRIDTNLSHSKIYVLGSIVKKKILEETSDKIIQILNPENGKYVDNRDLSTAVQNLNKEKWLVSEN